MPQIDVTSDSFRNFLGKLFGSLDCNLKKRELLRTSLSAAALYSPDISITVNVEESFDSYGPSIDFAGIDEAIEKWASFSSSRRKLVELFDSESIFTDEYEDSWAKERWAQSLTWIKTFIENSDYETVMVALAYLVSLLDYDDDRVNEAEQNVLAIMQPPRSVISASFQLLDQNNKTPLKITDFIFQSALILLPQERDLEIDRISHSKHRLVLTLLNVIITDRVDQIVSRGEEFLSFSDKSYRGVKPPKYRLDFIKKAEREYFSTAGSFFISPTSTGFHLPKEYKDDGVYSKINSLLDKIDDDPSCRFCFRLQSQILTSRKSVAIQLRKRLVKSEYLRVVVKLPNNTSPVPLKPFFGSLSGRSRGGPQSQRFRSCLMVVDGSRSKSPTFIDASNCIDKKVVSQAVNFDDELFRELLSSDENPFKSKGLNTDNLENEDYSLSVGAHIPLPIPTAPVGYEAIRLKEIAKLLKLNKGDPAGEVICLKRRSTKNGTETLSPLKVSEISSRVDAASLRYRSNELLGSALLVDKVFTNRLEALYLDFDENEPSRIYIDPTAFHPLEIDSEKVRVDWLLHAIDTDHAREYIRRRGNYGSFHRINIRDLLNIPILLPSLEQQKEDIALIKRERLDLLAKNMGLEAKIKESLKQEKLYLRAKTHTMAQQFNGLKSDISVLKKSLERYGYLDATETPIPNDSTTVSELTRLMYSSCLRLGQSIGNLDKKTICHPRKEFNLEEEVESWVARNKFPGVTVQYSSQSTVSPENAEESIPFLICNSSPEDLDVIITNLVENAIRHGFSGKDVKNPRVHMSVFYDYRILGELGAILRVANNGKPLPKSFTLEHFTAPQLATGITGNKGLGGWIISEILKETDATFEIVDPALLTDGYTTAFEIKYNLT
ncbi:hypothetical protein OAL40_00435 [bacterium]|nr:hypothetical protein [bacterium]